MADSSWLAITDWSAALASGWQIHNPAGRWQVEAGVLRIQVDNGDADRFLEIALPGELGIRGDFVLEINLRFLAVGLVDNDTNEASRLILELGTGKPLAAGSARGEAAGSPGAR